MKSYLIFMSMGFEIVGLILGCYYLGTMLDKTYNSKGLIFAGLSFLCLIAWLIRVVWMLNRIQKIEQKEEDSKSQS